MLPRRVAGTIRNDKQLLLLGNESTGTTLLATDECSAEQDITRMLQPDRLQRWREAALPQR